MGMHQFKMWLVQVIDSWREQVGSLPGDQQRLLEARGPIFRFHYPCQIDVVHICHPYHRLDFRLCLIRHFADEPDRLVRVIGHYPPAQAAAALEEYVKLPKWQREFPHDPYRVTSLFEGETTYAEALTGAMLNGYSSLRTYLQNTIYSQPSEGRDFGMLALQGACFLWSVGGRIEQSQADPAAYVSAYLSKSLENGLHRGHPGADPVKRQETPGLGAFLLPPTWIGASPDLSLKEYLEGVRPEHKARWNVVLSVPCAGFTFSVTQSGFFAANSEDREQVSQLLNQIFASILFGDCPALSISATDLIRIGDVQRPLVSLSYEDSVRPEQVGRLEGDRTAWWPIRFRQVLPVDEVERAMRQAEMAVAHPQQTLIKLLCLEAWSFYRRREQRSCLLSAWTGLELNIHELCSRHLSGRATSKQQKQRILGWDIGRMLDLLQLNGILGQREFDELDVARRKRNRVLHQGESVSRIEAHQSVNLLIRLTAGTWHLSVPEEVLTSPSTT